MVKDLELDQILISFFFWDVKIFLDNPSPLESNASYLSSLSEMEFNTLSQEPNRQFDSFISHSYENCWVFLEEKFIPRLNRQLPEVQPQVPFCIHFTNENFTQTELTQTAVCSLSLCALNLECPAKQMSNNREPIY